MHIYIHAGPVSVLEVRMSGQLLTDILTYPPNHESGQLSYL